MNKWTKLASPISCLKQRGPAQITSLHIIKHQGWGYKRLISLVNKRKKVHLPFSVHVSS